MAKGRRSSTRLLFAALTVCAVVGTLLTPSPASAAVAAAHPHEAPTLDVRVYVLDFDPIIHGQPVSQLEGWNDPLALDSQYISDVSASSAGTVDQRIAHTSVIRTFPTKPGGFVFTPEEYLACLTSADRAPACGQLIDYGAVLNTQYDRHYPSACEALRKHRVDEIWLWGGPWFGYFEYQIVDPSSLCASVDQRFVVMGFSYERTVAEMLHDLGHRSEALVQAGIGFSLWDRFDGQRERYGEPYDCPPEPDATHPEVDASTAHAGNVHFPPNAYCHYQYDRPLTVLSDAYQWAGFPTLNGGQTPVSDATWGGTQEGFLMWWLARFPRNPGSTAGVYNDWWRYVYPLVHHQAHAGTAA